MCYLIGKLHISFSGTLTPSPIRRQLDSVLNIIATKKVQELVHKSGPFEGEKVNVTSMLTTLVPAYQKYCDLMSSTNCDMGCPDEMIFNIDGMPTVFEMQDFTFEGRAVYCSNEDLCVFYLDGKNEIHEANKNSKTH